MSATDSMAAAKSTKTRIQLIEEEEDAKEAAAAAATVAAVKAPAGADAKSAPATAATAAVGAGTGDAAATPSPASSTSSASSSSSSSSSASASLSVLPEAMAAQVREAARVAALEETDAEPFKHRYEARDILKRLEAECTAQLKADPQNAVAAEQLGVVERLIGLNLIECEEWSTGEQLVAQALPRLAHKPLHYTFELIDGWNNLGVVWSNREQHQKAFGFLERAEKAYHAAAAYRVANPTATQLPICHAAEWERVEEKHTVFPHIGKAEQSATYCQMTLNRQLQAAPRTPLPNDWVQNCINLSFYFTAQKRLRQALYILSAAEHVFKPNAGQKTEAMQTLHSNLHRARGAMYLKWLQYSQQDAEVKKLIAERKAAGDAKLGPLPDTGALEEKSLETFASLHGTVALPGACAFATDFASAKPLFEAGLKAFTMAKTFYEFDGFVTEHVEIEQDISALYKAIAYFEPDLANRCKMHKRRVNALDPLIAQLNPNVYVSFRQQLTDEVARAYTDIAELKIDLHAAEAKAQKMTAKDADAAVRKINGTLLKAIEYHDRWLDTWKKDKKEPDTIDAEYHRPYLLAVFFKARLYGKLFSNDPKLLCGTLKQSLDLYRHVLVLVDKWKVTTFADEAEVCRELVALLPLKLNKIQSTGQVFRE